MAFPIFLRLIHSKIVGYKMYECDLSGWCSVDLIVNA